MIYKMIDEGRFPPLLKAGSASLLPESHLSGWIAALERGETPRYDPQKPQKKPDYIWAKVPLSFFDPLPTDEELDRQCKERVARLAEERARDPDWLPF